MCVGRGRERWEDCGLFWERAENSFAYRGKVTRKDQVKTSVMKENYANLETVTLDDIHFDKACVSASTSKDSLKLVL